MTYYQISNSRTVPKRDFEVLRKVKDYCEVNIVLNTEADYGLDLLK